MTYKAALDADARIAAKNALKIMAALRQTFDAKAVYEQYLSTQPNKSDNPAQDRARARAWAILNVTPNMQAMNTVMQRVLAEGYATGEIFAREQLFRARELKKSDDAYVDWANWKPGDRAAALLLRPPDAFQRLLQSQGIALKEMGQTTVRDIGNAVADAIDLGMSAERSAKNIMRQVANPARALSIAITEQNRAISFATVQRYKEGGLQQMEWEVSDPCDKCAVNTNQIVNIGSAFNSGDMQPPAHPHCRCVLLPVIPDFGDVSMPGATMIEPPAPVLVPNEFPTPKEQIQQAVAALHSGKPLNEGLDIYQALDARPFKPGAWEIVPRIAVKEAAIENVSRSLVFPMARDQIERTFFGTRIKKVDQLFMQKAVIYKNGVVEVQFSSTGLSLTEAERQTVLKAVEKLQLTNPKSRVVVHIDKNATGKFGWAYGGKQDLWVAPRTITAPKRAEGTHKMPATPATTQFEYTLAHEWGHLIDDITSGVQSPLRKNLIAKLKAEFPDAFKSQYSGENTKEFFAEMFTEYYNTGGKTPNLLVQAMAKEFGWKVPEPPVKTVTFAKNPAKVKDLQDWDKSAVIQVSKIKDPPSAPVKIWQGATNEYITTYRPVGGDPRLKALLEAQGFTAKPTVVSAADFKALADKGGIKVYRGVIGDDTLTAEQMVEMFKTGDMYVGTGVIGNGVYSGVNYEYVLKYAMDKPGNVLEMVLSPKAKFIEHDIAEKGAQKLSSAFYDAAFGRGYSDPEMGKLVDAYIEAMGGMPSDTLQAIKFRDELRALGWTFKDPGAYAAANGYDAIRFSDLADNGKDAMYVILNRGAVVVKE